MLEGLERWDVHKDRKEMGQHLGKQIEQQLALSSIDAVGKMYKACFNQDASSLEGDRC